jgi:hypothetical protein
MRRWLVGVALVGWALVAWTPDVRLAPLDPALAPVPCDLGEARRDLWGPVERFRLGETSRRPSLFRPARVATLGGKKGTRRRRSASWSSAPRAPGRSSRR